MIRKEPVFDASEARRRSEQALVKSDAFLAVFEEINKSIAQGLTHTGALKFSDAIRDWLMAHNYKVLECNEQLARKLNITNWSVDGMLIISWDHASIVSNNNNNCSPPVVSNSRSLFGSEEPPRKQAKFDPLVAIGLEQPTSSRRERDR